MREKVSGLAIWTTFITCFLSEDFEELTKLVQNCRIHDHTGLRLAG